MKLKKVSKILILTLILITTIITFNKYRDYVKQRKIIKIEQQKITDFSSNLRYNYKLEDKEYDYLDISSDKIEKLNRSNIDVKFNTVSFSNFEEYITTIIDNKIIKLYCDIPLSRENREFIKSKVHEENKIINVTLTKDNNIVFVDFLGEDKESAYIMDLKIKSVIWTMGQEFNSSYYKADTDSVIYTQTKNTGNSEIKEIRYEIILDNMTTNRVID